MGDGVKVVEREHDIKRSKTGNKLKSCNTNWGVWFGKVAIKCKGVEKNRGI